MVNISTRNVLADGNYFEKGHGVSIGSETSGWVTDVVVRNSVLDGTNLAVRLKTSRGRGGGIEGVLYENLSGRTNGGIQLNSACFVPRFVTQASCALRQLHAQRTMGLLPRLTSRRHLSCAT
jgi:polygalacturonase